MSKTRRTATDRRPGWSCGGRPRQTAPNSRQRRKRQWPRSLAGGSLDVSARTRAVIVNTPNNPTGHVFGRDELEIIARLCQEHDAVALADEIYEHIVYGDAPHVSLATLPGMAERTVTISGLSKTFCVTGWSSPMTR